MAKWDTGGGGDGGMFAGYGTTSQAQVSNDQSRMLQRRLLMLAQEVPEFNANDESLLAIASQEGVTDEQVLNTALQTVSAAAYEQEAASFNQKPLELRQAEWNQMSEAKRNLMISNGADDPSEDKPDAGGFSINLPDSIMGWENPVKELHLGPDTIGGPIGAMIEGPTRALGAVQHAGGEILEGTFHALTVANDVLPHIYRMGGEGDQFGPGYDESEADARHRFQRHELRNRFKREVGHDVSRQEWSQILDAVQFDDSPNRSQVDPQYLSVADRIWQDLESSDAYGDSLRNSWERTVTGENFIPYATQERSARVLGYTSPRMRLAVELAKGRTLEEIVTNEGLTPEDPRFSQRYYQLAALQSDPEIVSAVEDMSLGKVSLGREVAEGMGLDRNPDAMSWYGAASGAVDAAFVIAADPTLALGKLSKASRAARFAWRTTDELDHMYETGRLATALRRGEDVSGMAQDLRRVGMEEGLSSRLLHPMASQYERDSMQVYQAYERMAEAFADRAANGATNLPIRRLHFDMPETQRITDDLITWGDQNFSDITTPEGVHQFFRSVSGQTGLYSGFTKQGATSVGNQMVHWGPRQRLRMLLANGARKPMNVLNDWGTEARFGDWTQVVYKDRQGNDVIGWGRELGEDQSALHPLLRPPAALARGVSRFGLALTNQVPFDDKLMMHGPEAATRAGQLFTAGIFGNMPEAVRADFYERFVSGVDFSNRPMQGFTALGITPKARLIEPLTDNVTTNLNHLAQHKVNLGQGDVEDILTATWAGMETGSTLPSQWVRGGMLTDEAYLERDRITRHLLGLRERTQQAIYDEQSVIDDALNDTWQGGPDVGLGEIDLTSTESMLDRLHKVHESVGRSIQDFDAAKLHYEDLLANEATTLRGRVNNLLRPTGAMADHRPYLTGEMHESVRQVFADTGSKVERLLTESGDLTDEAAELTASSWTRIASRAKEEAKRLTDDFAAPDDTETAARASALKGLEDFATRAGRYVREAQINKVAMNPAIERRQVVNLALRRRITAEFFDQLFSSAGAYSADASEEATTWARNVVNHMDLQRYAPLDLDVIGSVDNPAASRAAILPMSHYSPAVALPDMRKTLGQMRRLSITQRALGWVNHPMVDAFMGNYWKPAMLLRLGFIPRAAGEELLSFVLRDGIMPWVRGVSAALGAQGDQTALALEHGLNTPKALLPFRPLTWVARKGGPLPEGEDAMAYLTRLLSYDAIETTGREAGTTVLSGADRLEALAGRRSAAARMWMMQDILDHKLPIAQDLNVMDVDPVSLTAHWLAGRTTRAVRDAAAKVAGSDYYRAALEVLNHPVVSATFGSTVSGHGSFRMAENIPEGTIYSLRKGNKITEIKFRATGGWQTYSQGDSWAPQMYQHAIDQLAADPTGRAALAAMQNQAREADLIAIFQNRGLLTHNDGSTLMARFDEAAFPEGAISGVRGDEWNAIARLARTIEAEIADASVEWRQAMRRFIRGETGLPADASEEALAAAFVKGEKSPLLDEIRELGRKGDQQRAEMGAHRMDEGGGIPKAREDVAQWAKGYNDHEVLTDFLLALPRDTADLLLDPRRMGFTRVLHSEEKWLDEARDQVMRRLQDRDVFEFAQNLERWTQMTTGEQMAMPVMREHRRMYAPMARPELLDEISDGVGKIADPNHLQSIVERVSQQVHLTDYEQAWLARILVDLTPDKISMLEGAGGARGLFVPATDIATQQVESARRVSEALVGIHKELAPIGSVPLTHAPAVGFHDVPKALDMSERLEGSIANVGKRPRIADPRREVGSGMNRRTVYPVQDPFEELQALQLPPDRIIKMEAFNPHNGIQQIHSPALDDVSRAVIENFDWRPLLEAIDDGDVEKAGTLAEEIRNLGAGSAGLRMIEHGRISPWLNKNSEELRNALNTLVDAGYMDAGPVDEMLSALDEGVVNFADDKVIDWAEGVTQRDTLVSFADTVINYAKAHVEHPTLGASTHRVINAALDNAWVTDGARITDTLGEFFPRQVVGPTLEAYDPSWYSKMIRFGFDSVIGPSISAIVRQPMFIHKYAEATHHTAQLERMMFDEGRRGRAEAIARRHNTTLADLEERLAKLPSDLVDAPMPHSQFKALVGLLDESELDARAAEVLDEMNLTILINGRGHNTAEVLGHANDFSGQVMVDLDRTREDWEEIARRIQSVRTDLGGNVDWHSAEAQRLLQERFPKDEFPIMWANEDTILRNLTAGEYLYTKSLGGLPGDTPIGSNGILDIMGLNRYAVYDWIDQHGGAEAFQQLVLEHELGHYRGRHMADRARRYREGRAGVTQVRISSIDHELAAVESELRSLGFPLDDKRYWQPHRERLILAPDNVRSREVARADEIYAARTPLAKMSSDELTEIRKYVTHRRHVRDTMLNTRMNRAVNEVLPYIDDHRIRSYWQVHARNIVPFWFAQEQFLKRWARTLVHSPEAIRRAQLLSQGLHHSGIIQEDSFGNDMFVIPMSESVSNFLASVPGVNRLYGGDARIPIVVPLTGQVQYALPGFDNPLGASSFGPAVAIPMGLARSAFPELAGLEVAMLGERGANRGIADQLFPSWAARIFDGVMQTPSGEQQMVSASIQAMAAMEAEGTRLRLDAEQADEDGDEERAQELFARAEELSPPDDATAEQVQHWIDNVKNWARRMIVMRGVFGFASPAQPTPEYPDNLRPEFADLLDHMSFEEAVGVFLADHPEGLPFTTGATDSPSRANAPITEQAMAWVNDNRGFMESFPLAGPWLIPQSEDTDEFSRTAYYEQIAMKMRIRKDPEEWYADLKFQEGAQTYFTSQDRYNLALAQLPEGDPKRTELRNEWNVWATRFKNSHPLFAQQLTGQSRQQRTEILDQMRLAFNAPNAPETPQLENLRKMVESYFRFDTAYNALSYDRSADGDAARSKLREGFSDWGETFIMDHPEATNLWRSVVELAADIRDVRLVTQELPAQVT